jgi:hypothetical protein
MSFVFFGLVVAPALAQPAVPQERDRAQPSRALEAVQECAHPPESAESGRNLEPADRSRPHDKPAKVR